MRSVVLASPARSRVWGALGALVLVFGFATSSHAGLGEATILQGATLQTLINNLDPISATLEAPVAATSSRDGTSQLTGVGFAAQVFATTGVLVPVTDPSAFPIAGILATVANEAAEFDRVGGKFAGQMGLIGVNKVCLFGTCEAAVTNLSVPISVVGVGGAAAASAAVNLTVVGAPWTQGTAAVGTITVMGNAGADTQMTNGTSISNVVSLVTPIFVSTNIAASAVVPVFGNLNFTLVSAPEPGTVAAFGAAIVSLLAVGFARSR
jgi:hypothetical protein